MRTLTTVEQKDREISLQFSFSNFSAIPQFLEDLPEENQQMASVRGQLTAKGTGEDLTNGQFQNKMVDLRGLPAGLLQTDYALIGAWKQERIKTAPGWGKGKPYWMIRFRFRQKNYLPEYITKIGDTAWQELVKKRPMLLGELVSICSVAFWQMRGWRNPWYQDGNLLSGVHAVSLNFEGRKPLYEWEPALLKFGDDVLPPQFEPDFVFNIQ